MEINFFDFKKQIGYNGGIKRAFCEVMALDFYNLMMKKNVMTLRFQPTLKGWSAKDRADHIIGVCLDGSSVHDFGYQKFTIEKDCIFYLNQKDDFVCNVIEGGPTFSIHFTTFEEVETPSFCIKVKNPVQIINLFEKHLKLASSDIHSIRSNFYRICSIFGEIHRKQNIRSDARVDAAKEFIDRSFSERDCLARVYENCSLSRRRLDELFRESFLITPSRYITQARISHAKQLLLLPNISISEISELCGFSDVYYFGKVFKAETGQSPGAFRKT